MAKKITQETFDSVVKENVQEFDMSPADAMQDAIEQFKAQGVDLTTLMMDVSSYLPDGSRNPQNNLSNTVSTLVDELKNVLECITIPNYSLPQDKFERLTVVCRDLTDICKKGLAERVVVSGGKTFEVLVEGFGRLEGAPWKELLTKDSKLPEVSGSKENQLNILLTLLTTTQHVTFQQPDLFTPRAFKLLEALNSCLVDSVFSVPAGVTTADISKLTINTFSTNPPSTNPPSTNPPSTNPPSTNPSSTNPPSTNPPSTNSPSTNPPSTNSPSTNPPSTNSPSTNPPSTNSPSTSPPSTNPPSTNSPSTNPPSTNPPSTNSPSTNSPSTLSSSSSIIPPLSTTHSSTTPPLYPLCLAPLQKLIVIFTNVCLMHEANKQLIADSSVTPSYLLLLSKIASYSAVQTSQQQPLKFVVSRVCAHVRALVTDDDVRVTFGHAHDRCVNIVNNHQGLTVLMAVFNVYNSPNFLDKSKEQSENIESTHNVLADIMNTLACLAVREEMCVCVCDEGGVKGVMGLLARWEGGGGGSKSDIALLKAALQCIKALSGSDKVKQQVVQEGQASRLIPAILLLLLHDASLCDVAFSCVASLCLRHAHLGAKFVDEGNLHVVVSKVMETHKNSPGVLRSCSLMIRNIVSRNKDKVNLFLDQGVEGLLNEAVKTHESKCGDEARYALRDLGCEVDLRVSWWGKGKQLER